MTASAKAGLFQPFKHVIVRFLRAELGGKLLGVEEWREVGADDALGLGVLTPPHLGVDRGENRMCGGLDTTAWTTVGTVARFHGVLVMAHEIIRYAQIPSDVDMVAIKAECGFKPAYCFGRPACPN